MPCFLETNTCFPKKHKIPHPNYTWSATWTSFPKNNVTPKNVCIKDEIKTNFIQKNREAIAKVRQDFLRKTKTYEKGLKFQQNLIFMQKPPKIEFLPYCGPSFQNCS